MNNDSQNQLLSGGPISTELQTVELVSSDVFLISRPLNGKTQSNYYRNETVSYSDLKGQIYENLSAKLNLKSMAYEPKGKYQPNPHDHFTKYNRASVTQFIKRNYNIDELLDDVVVVGHIVVDGRSYDICVPKIYQQDVPVPQRDIGTLKFLAVPNLKEIDENDYDFDGWTYPDGRFVSKSRFPTAYEHFRGITTEETETMFRIPILSNFIELNPYKETNEPTQRKDFTLGMKQHAHAIQEIDAKCTITVNATLPSREHIGQKVEKLGYHHGEVGENDAKTKMTITCDCSDIDFKCSDAKGNQQNAVENYPTYNLIPVLMYIGLPNEYI